MANEFYHEVRCRNCDAPMGTHCSGDPAESGGPDRPCPERVLEAAAQHLDDQDWLRHNEQAAAEVRTVEENWGDDRDA